MKLSKDNIAAGIVLYFPEESDIQNIVSLSDKVGAIYLVDNSFSKLPNAVMDMLMGISFCSIQYFHFPENIGLCSGMNFIMKKALSDSYSWCLLINQDSVCGNNIVEIFIEDLFSAADERIAIIGPQYDYDRHKHKLISTSGVKDVTWLMMSGNMINLILNDILGGFKENLFVDGLDVDYCLRARKEGFRVIQSNTAILLHKPATTKYISIFGQKLFGYGWAEPLRYYYQFRNGFWIFQTYRHWGTLFFMFYKLLKIIFLFDRKKVYLQAVKDAYMDFRHHYFGKTVKTYG